MATRKRRKEQVEGKTKLSVNVQTLKSRRILSEDQEEVELDAEMFQTDPAYVRVGHGVTKSIGDYESLRVEVAITVPCYAEMVDEVAKDCGEKVAVILEDELDAYGVTLHGK